jgi:hypothetical protein
MVFAAPADRDLAAPLGELARRLGSSLTETTDGNAKRQPNLGT